MTKFVTELVETVPENNYRKAESLHNTFQTKGNRIRGGDRNT